jgi:hypothetical protein
MSTTWANGFAKIRHHGRLIVRTRSRSESGNSE